MNSKFIRTMPLIAVLAAALTAAGCASDKAKSTGSPEASSAVSPATTSTAAPATTAAPAAKTVYPLTIENFTKPGEAGAWSAKKQTFDEAPKRVVANTQGAAELLIKLGLTDTMVGVAALYGSGDATIADEFKKIPVLAEGYVGKELVVGASPDLVMGRGGLYADADWGNGTVDGLNELGIKTYVQNASVEGATLQGLYKDIEELGQIFDVQEKAADFAAELKARAEALKQQALEGGKTYAYVSDAGDGAIATYSGNLDTYQADVLSLLGLKNTFGDVTGEISKEQLVATNPDILLISYYSGAPDPEKSIAAFYADPSLQSLNAVKNKAIYIIDFNQFWGYSYSIFDGAEKLAKELSAKP